MMDLVCIGLTSALFWGSWRLVQALEKPRGRR